MTQLREEGWIHHLARHAVACFLTRGDLWISWEEGMKVIASNLYYCTVKCRLKPDCWEITSEWINVTLRMFLASPPFLNFPYIFWMFLSLTSILNKSIYLSFFGALQLTKNFWYISRLENLKKMKTFCKLWIHKICIINP